MTDEEIDRMLSIRLRACKEIPIEKISGFGKFTNTSATWNLISDKLDSSIFDSFIRKKEYCTAP